MYLAGYLMLMCSGLLLGIIFKNMSIACMLPTAPLPLMLVLSSLELERSADNMVDL